MTIQLSTGVRNALLDSIETAIGASAILKVRTGAAPASPAAADAGTVVATLTLPADWMAAASGGTTCHLQGTITATGGGGDMTVDNTNFAAGQSFSITGFTLTAPNA